MRLKIRHISILFFLVSITICAQKRQLRIADNNFQDLKFIKAQKVYLKILEKDSLNVETNKRLGDIYMLLRKADQAEKYYQKIINQEGISPIYYYNYAQALKSVEKYEESKKWFEKYAEKFPDELRVKEFYATENNGEIIIDDSKIYKVELEDFNTKFSDFGIFKHENTIYFTSARDTGVAIKRKFAWNEEPFLDIYEMTSDSLGRKINGIRGEVNTKYHEGNVAITKDGKRMYFTRNNYHKKLKKDKNGVSNLKLFSAELIAGKWTNIKEISFNSDEYSVGHPALSNDGQTIYFSSNMPGGFGEVDIYKAEVKFDGSLGEPENLGDIINTEGNEMFPFISENEKLYFSSDGHLGFGQLDIFSTIKNEENEIVNILNLGSPINSPADDFAYFKVSDSSGYFSSNREGGVGSDDIYKYEREIVVKPLYIKGKVLDAINEELIVNAEVKIRLDDENELLVKTDSLGNYNVEVERGQVYNLNISKKKFATSKVEISTKIDKRINEIERNVYLKPIEDIRLLVDLNTIYFDLNKSYIRKDAAEELDKIIALMLGKYPKMKIKLESHTDSRGNDNYNMKLSKRRAKSTYDYLVKNGVSKDRIESFDGFGETLLLNQCDNEVKCDDKQHDINRRTEFIITKMK
ncbi:OmpA family protein [Aureivirga sp. CE67]|uniref:OmpA family protein n=1 Tax=Aureivirga sp. CE67 TaxID=1788983 RepID=UPI0018CA50F2|nr:OmpA family protein [Aureivirga sp. CE67]